METNKKEKIFIVVLIILGIIISFQLNLSPISKNRDSIIERDSQVFVYIGKAIHNGQVPYKDIFDHKGPLLYLINFLGTFFENNIGIWIIETIFTIISMIFIFKISKLLVKKDFIAFFISCLITCSRTIFIGYSGNYVEEYAMPFILISLYFYIDSYLKNNFSSKRKNLLIGFCCGCVLMLRINMVVLWLIYSIYIFIRFIKEDRKILSNYIMYFIIGNLIAIIPFCIYLLINGAFIDFIYQYITFNFMYSANNKHYSIKDISIYFLSLSPILILSFILFLIKDEDKKLKIVNLFFLIVTFLIVILPGNNYLHYGLILIPCYIYPICNFYNYISKEIYINTFIFVCFMIIFFIVDIAYTIIQFKYINFPNTVDVNEESIVNFINNVKEENDNLLVIGNWCNFYLLTNLQSCSKYIYQFPVGYVDNQIVLETINDIEEKEPRFIIKAQNVEEENIVQEVESLENSNKYEKILEGYYTLYVKSD